MGDPRGDLKAMLSSAGRLKLIAVARDTAGTKYSQKHTDSLPIQLPDRREGGP